MLLYAVFPVAAVAYVRYNSERNRHEYYVAKLVKRPKLAYIVSNV